MDSHPFNPHNKPMKTTYLGLAIDSPVIVASSPYTATLNNVERCAANGAGAVVLKSIFEEQIVRQAASLEYATTYADADSYLQRYLGDDYIRRYLTLIEEARNRTSIPIIASINCISLSDEWVAYAKCMERSGASALELNIFLPPLDPQQQAASIERNYLQIVQCVAEAVSIPVSVKLPMRFTNLFNLAEGLLGRGARGAVLFNRYFEPEIDIEHLTLVAADPYSQPAELRNVLRTTARCTAVVPQLEVAVSGGVHTGDAAVKSLLCGAQVVQLCTAIHNEGYEIIRRICKFIDEWADRHNFCSVEEFRGRMNLCNITDPQLYERVQYMKYYPDTPD